MKKSLELGHAIFVVVNKIDKPSARPDFVINSILELFIELNASDEQCDFQVTYIYASDIKGKGGRSPENLAEDLGPPFDSIIRGIPGPQIDKDGSLKMLVTNIEYDEHKIAIGCLHAGICREEWMCKHAPRNRHADMEELVNFSCTGNMARFQQKTVEAGDICAVSGIDAIEVGSFLSKQRSQYSPVTLNEASRNSGVYLVEPGRTMAASSSSSSDLHMYIVCETSAGYDMSWMVPVTWDFTFGTRGVTSPIVRHF
ncbi:putative elongation factor TypA-like SVR3, chloroplastic [Cornus florida]|uniref:putative elongation factor TypA-like SVR3, chloroplastic n=1 Tax=Cornus florida TaxID=4283 RepID=UPI002898BBD0|nr:putative elongation factor TypA-like SVR3, chloroplastic [Cornus florida]XP_059646430.1 putative elongation factor TypA-like SVR3, chloroplastic [Cornus florida]XP_059646431.1 putative elongation factor TypA-like SVR3, chloroplastic [Cornus florida]